MNALRNLPCTTSMGVTFFKRYRMEIDLEGDLPIVDALPPGYRLVPWHCVLLEEHAAVKYRCFVSEIDATVFPCLGDVEGCRRLMNEITRREGFLPAGTWLVQYVGNGHPVGCGTIQTVRDADQWGCIQNVGITPEHRGRGLGSCLVRQALEGVRQIGIRRAMLEVTAENEGAVRLYQRLGFRLARTVYKSVDVVAAGAH